VPSVQPTVDIYGKGLPMCNKSDVEGLAVKKSKESRQGSSNGGK
jgi:hypothetical protein